MIGKFRIRGHTRYRHIDTLAFDSFPALVTKNLSLLDRRSRGKSKEVGRLRLIGAGQKG